VEFQKSSTETTAFMLFFSLIFNNVRHYFVALVADFTPMQICNTTEALKLTIDDFKEKGNSIGFVATMGALHNGHLSLVSQAKKTANKVVVSIFVNPTQFNNPNDLSTYPRTLEADCKLLEEQGFCDLIFAPKNAEEVYTQSYQELDLDLSPLDSVMEGPSRPNHFKGVVNVVNQLFKLVNPNTAFFGEKDFQQLAIIKKMTTLLALPITIVGVPIKREDHGLAMSSRNERLNPKDRADACIIFQALSQLKQNYLSYSLDTCVKNAVNRINSQKGFEVEYLTIVDGKTLQPINEWHQTDYAQVCVVVSVGDVRLIDNINVFKPY